MSTRAVASEEWRAWLTASWEEEVGAAEICSSKHAAGSASKRRVDVGVPGATPRTVREYEPALDRRDCLHVSSCLLCDMNGPKGNTHGNRMPVGGRLCDMLLFGSAQGSSSG